MKAGDHMNLTQLVHRLEHRRHVSEAATVTMAILGVIAFGTMIVPIYFTNPVNDIAENAPAASSASSTPDAFQDVHLIGKAAVVYDLTTKHVLYEYNATERLPLASLTKLITIYAAASTLTPVSTVVITPTAVAQQGDGADLHLAVGQRFTFEDIARYALVASSNTGAEAIAEAAAREKATTNTDLLASAIAALGLAQTNANNGTGLDETSTEAGAYGSAQDVAVLAGDLLTKAPVIARATTYPSVTIADASGVLHTEANTNQDIVTVPSPLLSKTGYTDLAGGNLVVVFDAGINHPVAVVVLGSTEAGRFTDVQELIGRTLDQFGGVAPH